MPIPAGTLLQHLEYTRWATLRTIGACRGLSGDELARDFGTSFGGIQGTLIHIFCADRMWLSRIEGRGRDSMLDPGEEVTLESLEREWPAVLYRLIARAKDAFAGSVERDVIYKRTNGEERRTPVWQVILHAVNHASYHRGQVAALLRQLGQTPPNTDLITYYRSLR